MTKPIKMPLVLAGGAVVHVYNATEVDAYVAELERRLGVAKEALLAYESAHYDDRGYACRGDKTASMALAALNENKGE